ncbi:SHOCT domain-containing protein [Flagellimonas pacifica]|uniref:Putative membrane protein n=1 Tax=Flagellimonas pacifica TaxID=1247520 RepID=A0A285MW73_9FLAO|nr:SHOCT domain-containing protein [Allomuricauda parva]SNZ01368.1 putative membrane protein [Allomuricauda parva]
MFLRDGIFWGMHLIWWAIWLVALGWIFFAPSNWPLREEEEENDALTVLKIRFAKGEITKEEYRNQKKVLELDA